MSQASTLAAPLLPLSGGTQLPALGLGTWPMDDAQAAPAVASALRLGYRLIDTAQAYGNEKGVGEGLRLGGVPREEIVLTTKFNREFHSRTGVREAAQASLARLGTDYIDLYLIHWPNPALGRYVEAFEGLVRLREEGLVRAIGVCNFKVSHLEALFAAGFVPEVNQIQLDPQHRRDDLLALHRERGIVTEGWSPLGRGGDLLAHRVLTTIAQAHGRTTGQIALRWQVQQGIVPIPKSADPARQAQNLAVFDFTLSSEEMAALDGLDAPDPEMLDADTFGH